MSGEQYPSLQYNGLKWELDQVNLLTCNKKLQWLKLHNQSPYTALFDEYVNKHSCGVTKDILSVSQTQLACPMHYNMTQRKCRPRKLPGRRRRACDMVVPGAASRRRDEHHRPGAERDGASRPLR